MSEVRDASTANKGQYDRDVYRLAIGSQNACNLSGLAHDLTGVMQKLWDEAHSLGEGTEYVNRHPVVALFLHQMAHLNRPGCDLLGDGWLAAWERVNDMVGNFNVEFGSLRVFETTNDFTVVLEPTDKAHSMGDGVDRYSDASGVTYNVGTPEFYTLLREEVRANHDTLVEAFFGQEVGHV